MEWERILLKARILKEQFLKSYKCLNIDRDTKEETVTKHIANLVQCAERIRVLFNVNYSRLTHSHKIAAEAFFSDIREKLISVSLRKGVKLEISQSIHEEIPPFIPEPSNNDTVMPQTVVEFLNTASRLIPEFDGTAENLQSFLDALSLVDSIKETHDAIAVNLIKTKLKGTARNLISTESTLQEIISKLRATVKGESVEVVTAKLMNVRQQGKTANSYAKEIEDLTKKLETAYITDGLPSQIAATYATRSATKAIIKNASNERVKLIIESGSFTNLNDLVAKFISSCTEAYGQPNSILTFGANRQPYGTNSNRGNFRQNGQVNTNYRDNSDNNNSYRGRNRRNYNGNNRNTNSSSRNNNGTRNDTRHYNNRQNNSNFSNNNSNNHGNVHTMNTADPENE